VKKGFVLWFVACFLLFLMAGAVYAQMAVIDGIVEGDQTIAADAQLLSIIRGNVTVSAGVTFQLDGIVTGNVTVEGEAVLVLNGIVNGDVTLEEGASVELNGIVGGSVYNRSGNAIDPDAIDGIVKGEIVNL